MRERNRGALMAIVSAAGFVATVIDGAVDGISAWNLVAIAVFVVVFYVGLTTVQRSAE
jgi:hypothetical protein